MILARSTRYDEAIALLRTVVDAKPRSEDVREACRVGMLIAAASDDPETLNRVEGILTTAVKIDPYEDAVTVMLALFRHIQGNFADEVRLYKAVLEHRPDSDLVLNNLAWALSEGLGEAAEALVLIDKLVKPGTRHPAARHPGHHPRPPRPLRRGDPRPRGRRQGRHRVERPEPLPPGPRLQARRPRGRLPAELRPRPEGRPHPPRCRPRRTRRVPPDDERRRPHPPDPTRAEAGPKPATGKEPDKAFGSRPDGKAPGSRS